MKTIIKSILSFILLFTFILQDAQCAEPNLPRVKEIYTVAFDVWGKAKESRVIFSAEELTSILEKATYIGQDGGHLKQPLEKYYWNQTGVIVLRNKTVYSFTVYEGQKSHERFLEVYFPERHDGVHLFRLPANR